MVEETSDENSTTNKGVNVRSDTCPCTNSYKYFDSETSTSEPETGRPRSITAIKNSIQNVLDMMGPSTPLLSAQQTSSDADNEESVASMVRKSKKREISSSDSEITKCCSILADIGSITTDNPETLQDISTSENLGAHVCINPECMCMMGYMNETCIPVKVFPPQCRAEIKPSAFNKSSCEAFHLSENKKRGIINWIKHRPLELMLKKSSSCTCNNPCELYKLNVAGQENEGGPPKRVIFDLVEGIPRPPSTNVATNTIMNPVEKLKASPEPSIYLSNNEPPHKKYIYKDLKNFKNEQITQDNGGNVQKNISLDSKGDTRVDFYYFDHGNAHYFHTTDTPPVMICEILAERTEKYTTKFWAEFFASIHIGVSFCVSFILQLFKFLLYSIIRPLIVGLMQLWSDYFFKPFLTTLFNGIIQPKLIFLYNIATSVRDLMDPIAECFGYFCREFAVLFKAIRLCSYKRNDEKCTAQRRKCGN